MTTTSRRLLTATAATFALGVAFSGAAFADAPTAASLTAPTVTFGAVGEPGNDGLGYEIAGAGCIGTGGTPGEVTFVLTDAVGTVSDPVTVTADANGNWMGWLVSSTGETPAGNVTVAATCDIYNQSINYPQGTGTVVSDASPLPGIRADLSGERNSVLTVTIGGCITPQGITGQIDYVIGGPNDTVLRDTVSANTGGATSITTDGTLGEWAVVATCSVGGVVTNYAPFGFTISNNGSGSDSAVGDDTGTDTGTGSGSGSGTVDVSTDGSTVNVSVNTPTGSNAAGPQLANTGVEAAPYGLAAGALLVGGAALTLAGRRRTA